MPQSARILTPACPKPAVPLEDCQQEYGRVIRSASPRRSRYTEPSSFPLLLYGAHPWVLCRKQIRLLERFHQRRLRSILGIQWQDYVSNEEVLKHRVHLAFRCICVGLATPQVWKTYACPKQSSSASSKKESMTVVLQESVTKASWKGSLHRRESAVSYGSRKPQTETAGAHQ